MKRYSCGRLGMYEDSEGRYVLYQEPATAYAGETIRAYRVVEGRDAYVTSTGRIVGPWEAEFIAVAAGQEWPL